jgi:hypothetical protein
MRRLLAVILAATTFAAGVATWELVGSFRCPVANARGYAASSTVAGWTVSGDPTPYVYHFNFYIGSILSSFPAPGGAGAWGVAQLAYNVLYVSNNRTSWIYLTHTTGSIYSSFPCPIPGPADLDIRETQSYLYVAIPARNIIAVVNQTTGSLVSTFAGPGSQPTGCCGYGMTLISDSATHTIYEDGVPVITGIQTPVGIDDQHTIDSMDIDYFLFALDAATNYIYRYDNLADVEPASLGRVKALFR